MISIMLILDMFHSRTFKEISNNKNKLQKVTYK
jgi:hypothetical protein